MRNLHWEQQPQKKARAKLITYTFIQKSGLKKL